jgi:hypothetical protein
LRERGDDLRAAGIERVYAVTFEPATRSAGYRAREQPGFPLLRDPRRAGYAAFGLGRGGTGHNWRPATAWYYVLHALRGRLPRLARTDYGQLGGDVLLARDGSVAWVYRSREPADRPSIDTILRAARQIERPG